jgi:hypothetical protein
MKAFRFLFVFFISAITHAQAPNGFGAGYSDVQSGFSGLRSFFNVVNSEPITAPNNPRQLNGTPFFSDEWMKGIITLSDGKSYKGERLRVDLLNTKLFFVNQDGQEKVCVSAVDRVLLLDSVNGRVYHFIHSYTLPVHPDLKDSAWLEVLQPGKAELIKYQKKELIERASYASAPEDIIKTQSRYYLLHNKRLYKVAAFRDLKNILADRKTEIDAYITKQQPSWKNETDIINLVAYYNSLQNK